MRPLLSTSAIALAAALVIAAPGAVPGSAQPAAQPADSSWSPVDAVFGAAGKDLPGGVHRFGWPRRDLHVQMGEIAVEPALALGSWGAFLQTGKDGTAMAMGDLVLLETELAPVLAELQAGGLEISAIHNHLVGESPHAIYVHFSGHGKPALLAAALKKALARTATPLAAPPPPDRGRPARGGGGTASGRAVRHDREDSRAKGDARRHRAPTRSAARRADHRARRRDPAVDGDGHRVQLPAGRRPGGDDGRFRPDRE